MIRFRKWRFACAGALMVLAAGNSAAQTAPPAGTKVSGALLQTWLDQKFSYVGVHRASGCLLMNTAEGSRRALFLRCPDEWSSKLSGTAKVVGDTYCTNFPIPNSTPGDDCVTWHSLGQWRFEQRKGDMLDTTVIVLPAGLGAAGR